VFNPDHLTTALDVVGDKRAAAADRQQFYVTPLRLHPVDTLGERGGLANFVAESQSVVSAIDA
jgi:hypothetical protein